MPFPGLRTALVNFEYAQCGSDLRHALSESVQARSENDVLADAAFSFLCDQILDEASAGHSRRPEAAGTVLVHVGPLAPTVVGAGQLQADLVFEYMRRRVDLDVHGPPQGDPYRRAFRCRDVLITHDVLRLTHGVLRRSMSLHGVRSALHGVRSASRR